MSPPRTFILTGLMLSLAACGTTDKRAAPIREYGVTKIPTAKPVLTGFYQVRPGDTLYGIAFQNGLDYRDLALWNNLADPGLILAGATLRLTPPVQKAPVQPAAAVPIPASPQALPAEVTWKWPAEGQVINVFDESSGNKGIDIAASKGTPVRAAAAGRVMYAGDGLRGYGKLIIIKHSDSLLSAYAHQERILVAEGERVAQGRQVGSMGDSDADRVKLHFEIREYGKPVDPLKYLP